MLTLISTYWGAPCRKIIECYVVKDLDKWPPNSLDPTGLQHIIAGGGVTLSQSLRLATKQIVDADAVVYAIADRGVPLHEAVHAYCALTFGRTGPTWYSEGMAEMGNYWRKNDSSVQLEPVVMQYLQEADTKSLNDLVNGQQSTGDSWREYAWRWALCHLLANNPNYAQRFRPLGLSILNDKKVTFEQVYGPMAKEISFEYKFFIDHLDQGLRADLISFDWKRKFRESRGSSPVRVKISAQNGWQPSGLMVEADTKYEYSAEGTWTLTKGGMEHDSDGTVLTPMPSDPGNNIEVIAKPKSASPAEDAETGKPVPGRLMGIVLSDDEINGYQLSEPFLLGRHGCFTAPATGNLYLRCYDNWNQIADNSGSLLVRLKTQGIGQPLKEPPAEVAKPLKAPAPVSKSKARSNSRRQKTDK